MKQGLGAVNIQLGKKFPTFSTKITVVVITMVMKVATGAVCPRSQTLLRI